MGTRLWYALWDAAKDDDDAFERRLDSVVREIGERGKVMVSEAVPPLRKTSLVPTPAPSPAPTSTKAATATLVPAPSQSASSPGASATTTTVTTAPAPIMPSAARVPIPPDADEGGGPRGSFVDMIVLLREERELMKQMMIESEKQRRQQQEETVSIYEKKIELQRKEIEELRLQKHQDEVHTAQVSMLQTRLESLHSAKLLTVSKSLLPIDNNLANSKIYFLTV